MNYLGRIKDIYKFEVSSFDFLLELGFLKCLPPHVPNGCSEVEYKSNNFIFTIGMHDGRDENYRLFKDALTKNELTYPEVVLNFFINDYEKETEEIRASIKELDPVRANILVEIELYKRHSWVLTSNDWVANPDLTQALDKENQWFYSQLDMKSALSKFESKLRSFRTGNYIFNEEKQK